MNKSKIIIYILIVIAGIIIGLLLSGCDYFQKKTYTAAGEDTSLKTVYELCLKSKTQSDCVKILESITPSGKLEDFKECVDYENANKKKLEKYRNKFDCYDLNYGKKED